MRSARSAELVATKVIASAQEPFVLNGIEVQIGASVGVALGADGSDAGAAPMHRADAQLYRAKQRGCGRVSGETMDRETD